MKGIRYDANGMTLIFGPEGSVGQLINGETPIVGNWRSQSAERDNKIRYDIRGQEQAPIPCRYKFNGANQLVAALRKPDGTYTPDFTFIGFIAVDDNADIVFTLITGEGATMSRNVIVYGALHFDSSSFLAIDLAGGGSARISGDGGSGAIDALANLSDPRPQAGDLLRFNASTVNQLASGKRKTYPARIQLKGNWDIQDDSLVFMASHEAGQTKVGFAGKFKGVAAGFAYSPDGAGAKVAFVVSGRHVWNSGTASWDVVLGHTQKQFQAHVSGAVAVQLPNGAIALNGQLDISSTTASFALSLQARHTWNAANQLTFMADVSTGPGAQLNYDLKLEGTFRYNGLQLTFDAMVSNTGASVAVTLASSGNQDALKMQLSFTLSIMPNQVDIAFTFSLRMHWENGKLVKEAPQAAIAAPAQ